MAAQTASKPEPDVLELNDGEKLIGHLVSASGGSVIFHSDAAGDVTVDWAKVKSLKSSGKFAVVEKGIELDKHTDVSKIPQGTITAEDQKLQVSPGTGANTASIPVAAAANVVPQPSFLRAFQHPRFRDYWHGSASLGVDLVSATQKSRNITAGVSLSRTVSNESWIDPRYKTSFDLNLADGQLSQSGTPTIKTDIIHAAIEHDLYFSKRLFALVSGDFLHSLSQGMKLQQTYGGGLGFVVLKDEHQELDVKGSVDYVRQSFEDMELPNGTFVSSPGKSLIAAVLGESYTRGFRHGVALRQGVSYIPAFNDSKAYTANAFVNIFIPVSKSFAVTIGGVDAYINEPPTGFKKNSFQFLTQLTYKIN